MENIFERKYSHSMVYTVVARVVQYRTTMFLSSVKETAGMDFHRVCVWWFSLDHIWCLHCTYFIKGTVNLVKSEI